LKNYIYHFGVGLFSDIRPIYLQKNGAIKKREAIKKHSMLNNDSKYFKEVNAFPSRVTIHDVKLLIDNNFVNWEYDNHIYCYVVDLMDNKNNIGNINITSTPEQVEYDKKYWKPLDTTKKDFNTEISNYKIKRKAYLESKGVYEDMTIEQYIDFTKTHQYVYDMKKYFKLNSKIGFKSQYASVIPHLQITVNNPLQYFYFIKFYKEYYVDKLNINHIDNIMRIQNASFDYKWTNSELKKIFKSNNKNSIFLDCLILKIN